MMKAGREIALSVVPKTRAWDGRTCSTTVVPSSENTPSEVGESETNLTELDECRKLHF